ncbi:MAG: response regulator transcription factor [Rhodocyclaceae bacterium]|nr:MAG: response regulator transcription factor [Rhodocyclaceae bacterium]
MIELLLVDDHAVVREGYRRLLERRSDLHVATEAGDAEEALQLLRTTPIDLIVLDLSLPGMGGIELTRRILQRFPEAKILAFSMHRDPLFASQALRAGALGYVTKSSSPEILIQAIYKVARNEKVLSPDIAPEMALSLLEGDSNPADDLSPREFEVLRLLLAGQAVEEIAGILNISPKTVQNTHYQIKTKLGVRSDFELAKLAMKLKLVD